VGELEPRPFEARGAAGSLAGETIGEGPAVLLLHGLTATRRYVVHGSKALPRRGYTTITYDARGHGDSDSPPPEQSYDYSELAADLDAVIDQRTADERPVIVGHSMGVHTAVSWALGNADRVAALVAIGPASTGVPLGEEVLEYWDRLADGLESGGVEGFIEAYDIDLDPRWRDVLLRISRERLAAHRHPEAVARALREVPRSMPFDGVSELEFLDVPALIVASHDDSDPGHPYAIAEAWAESLPQGRLINEERGQSPLAWQGGRLSRAIADFVAESKVAERLGRAT
jgi:pimeloyl-ACP methyl ester carboxylesterase